MALVSLTTDREFRKVRAHGQVIRHKYFQLRITDYRPRYGEVWQPRAIIGIVVPKKTLKHAVDRNRVRRRVHEALRTLPGLVPCRAIISPAALVLNAPFADLQAALGKALGSFDPKKARRPAGKAAGNSGRTTGVQNKVNQTAEPSSTSAAGEKP
ncbi:ribonuclease P protein component [Deinococcus sp. KNUC1210]|uniref:ribonuclease P protein component n=1 Tax=Deinococcus sp. KNUC1210 TaxID=2917691 RepID=UPI001EF0F519|nr:ribonuclease P protein component [Deinococcus sp. KNUC1210]ULH16549.1 ribonuclease P protein component [Deinococcus sp. KNUC1210]